MKTAEFVKHKGHELEEVAILRNVKTWIDDAAYGHYVISFRRYTKPRSKDQNKLMWVWFSCIACSWSERDGVLWDAQQVHDKYCGMFLQYTLPDGTTAQLSTSRLSSEQFSTFLNKVQEDARENHGIRLLSMTDIRYEQWAKQYLN